MAIGFPFLMNPIPEMQLPWKVAWTYNIIYGVIYNVICKKHHKGTYLVSYIIKTI